MKKLAKETGLSLQLLKLMATKGIISFSPKTDDEFAVIFAMQKIVRDMELSRAICMSIRKDRRPKLLEYPMSKTERYILQEYLAAESNVRVNEMQNQVWTELRIKTSVDYIKRIRQKASNIKTGRIDWPPGILTQEELRDRKDERKREKDQLKRREESERLIL